MSDTSCKYITLEIVVFFCLSFVFTTKFFELKCLCELTRSDATSAVSDVPDDSSVAEAATVTNPPVTQPPAPSHNWGPGQQLEHDEDVNAAQNIAGLFTRLSVCCLTNVALCTAAEVATNNKCNSFKTSSLLQHGSLYRVTMSQTVSLI
jgi:hypothetical protein